MEPSAFKDAIFGDVERELDVTRKVLSALPSDQFDWAPHTKSMSLGKLALHVATLPGWAQAALAADVLDFAAAPRPPAQVESSAELLAVFDNAANGLREEMARFDPAGWNRPWTMRNGEQVFTTAPRPKVFRIWSLNHLVHHRGQLCLYLRLLNVVVPTVYFNTSDDPTWSFE